MGYYLPIKINAQPLCMKILLIDGDFLVTRLPKPGIVARRPQGAASLNQHLARWLRRQLASITPTHVLWIWQGARTGAFLDNRRQRRVDQALNEGLSQRLHDMGIHQLKLDGSRTGSVLAAVAQMPRPATAETIIIGNDPLYYTLLGQPQTLLHDPFSRARTRRWMTPEAFNRQYGILPEQWPLCLALAGHPSAAIKGVPGIGQKSALRLLADAGLTDIDKIALKAPGRHGLLLRQHRREIEETLLPSTSLRATPALPFALPDIRYRRPETPRPGAQPSH